jgi:neutral ceramidase
MVRIGIAERIITPPLGSSLVGYFSPRPASGIRDDLKAIALCFDDGTTTAFIVALDLIWAGECLWRDVKQIARKKIPSSSLHITLHATHTHTGPLPDHSYKAVYTENFTISDEYPGYLRTQIVDAMREAYDSRFPATIGCGSVDVDGFSFNRRYRLRDGRVVTNPTQPQEIIGPAGPVSSKLSLLKIADDTGFLKAIALNYGNHPDTLGGTEISGDWPSMTRDLLSEEYGVPVILFNDACGDIAFLDPFDSETRSSDIGEKIAEALGRSASGILTSLQTLSPVNSLFLAERTLSIPRRTFTDKEIESAKINIEAFPGTLRALVAKALFMQMEEKSPLEHSLFLVGLDKKCAFLCTSGEIFTETGFAFREDSSFEETMIVENCNAVLGYIPTAKAFKERAFNLSVREEEFHATPLDEAIGIDASYETSYLGCMVDERAEGIVIEGVKKLFSDLSR